MLVNTIRNFHLTTEVQTPNPDQLSQLMRQTNNSYEYNSISGFYATIQLSSGDRYWIEPMAPKSPNADLDDHVVYHSDDVVPLGGHCGGARLVDEVDSFSTDGASPAGLTVEVCEIGVDADFQYFQDYGSVAATEDRKAAKVMIPPYEREIYVITMIKKKIIDKCAGDE